MIRPYCYKKILLQALKTAGLPHTATNFLYHWERTLCQKTGCPYFGEPYLASPRNKSGARVYLYEPDQCREIIEAAKEGWFVRHWHWRPTKIPWGCSLAAPLNKKK
jgi:hypothetical protein